MKWEDYKAEFEFDGSWRDIYILKTSVSDWQLLLDFLHSDVYEYSCTIGGEDATLPQRASEIFDADHEFKPLLSVKIGTVIVNCHFFTEEEIEFDLDPREIKSEIQADQVFGFMRQVGHAVSKEVVLTPENMQEMAIFKFHPGANELQYIQCET